MAGQGHSILVYGASGIGKSTDVLYTFRKAAWLLTEPGGLIPAAECIGFDPHPVYELFDVDNPERELVDVINKDIIPMAQQGQISSVVLDTGSEWADRMMTKLMSSVRDPRQAYGGIVGSVLTPLRRLINLKQYGVWVICICHETGPALDSDTKMRLRGGPLLPGKNLPRSFPPKFDLALRATVDQGLGEATRIYQCDPLDPDYITKQRGNAAPKKGPMELGPIVWRISRPGQPVPPEMLSKKLNLHETLYGNALSEE